MRKFLCILIVLPWFVQGQIGGQLDYNALNFTSNARSAALAGSSITLGDGDLSQFFENPAVLDSVTSGNLFINVNPYFADVNVYSAAYSFDIKEMEGFALGVHFINFGSFEMTDETGAELGTFAASDYVISIGKAHQLGPITLGANLKLVNSSIDIYSSTAISTDIGGLFRVNKNWTLGMVLENMGLSIAENNVTKKTLPFDVKLGTSFKPEYMPFRFTLTSVNLTDRNLSLEEETTGRSNSGVDNVLKRINLGAELLLSNNFQLLFGYNHKRKQELRLETLGGGAGFSFGLMVKIKQVQMRYSRATYHAAGGTSFISLQTNLKDFKKIL